MKGMRKNTEESGAESDPPVHPQEEGGVLDLCRRKKRVLDPAQALRYEVVVHRGIEMHNLQRSREGPGATAVAKEILKIPRHTGRAIDHGVLVLSVGVLR